MSVAAKIYLCGLLLAAGTDCAVCIAQAQVRVLEIVADKDSRFKAPDGERPKLTLKAGEQVQLRVTANKAKSWNRDGSIHGFTLLRASDRSKVPGWNLLLRPGTQEFTLTAPAEPGNYLVVCTVICSEDHEGMNMKLLVVP
jgi:heme/copper-type cytochrome/quinol oxidase subunit 2